MTGMPGETEEEMKQTFDLALDLDKRYPEFEGHILPFRLYPGSPMYDDAVRDYGYKAPETIAEWVKFEDDEIKDSVGYQHSSHYPWIPNKNKFELRNKVYATYQRVQWDLQKLEWIFSGKHTLRTTLEKRIKYYLFLLIYKLSRFRLLNEFYKFHFENELIQLLSNLKHTRWPWWGSAEQHSKKSLKSLKQTQQPEGIPLANAASPPIH
jgi:radical SAM superfamily enzyme YgiQ (UPF0313 family)